MSMSEDRKDFERLMDFLQESNSDKKDERSVARNDDKTFKT